MPAACNREMAFAHHSAADPVLGHQIGLARQFGAVWERAVPDLVPRMHEVPVRERGGEQRSVDLT